MPNLEHDVASSLTALGFFDRDYAIRNFHVKPTDALYPPDLGPIEGSSTRSDQ